MFFVGFDERYDRFFKFENLGNSLAKFRKLLIKIKFFRKILPVNFKLWVKLNWNKTRKFG